MTWTYGFCVQSTQTTGGRRDAVRLLINDLSSGSPLRQDEEISFALAQEGNNLYRGAALLCETLADSAAVSKKVGDLSLGAEKAPNYRALASRYRNLAALRGTMPYAAALSSAQKDTYRSDPDRVKPSFTLGMMQRPGTMVGTTST